MTDLIIRGMEMPNNVFDCPLNSFGICNLAQDETHCDCIGDSRPEWCPLVPLPEGHGRCIEADALLSVLDILKDKGCDGPVWDQMRDIVKSMVTIIPAEGGGDNG